MTAQPNSPEARDIAYHLHGYTDARKHADAGPLVIVKGDGVYVEDNHGNRYIEAMSGLWSVALGFSEPRLVAAAVALETIKIIEERGLVAHAAEMGQRLQSGLRAFKDHPLIGEVRGVGLIAAIELVTDKTTKKALDPAGKLGMLVNGLMQKNGVITRAMGDALAFCPPLITTAAEIDLILAALGKSLDEAAKTVL